MAHSRLPRFTRSPDTASMRLTERDREILRHVHRHRFLRSSHLRALMPGSKQQIGRRLQRLYHHGFLERPRCQIDYYYRKGSRPIAYGLGNKGAGLLKRELALPFHRMDWPRKNRVERFFLEHALLISDFMVALETACRNRRDIRLLTEDDLQLRDQSVSGRSPFRWRVNIPGASKCGVIPDRTFGLESSDGNRTWFLLEADRATMPVIRSDLNQSSFRRKLLAYQATWAQNLHRTQFGWERFRVLTITLNIQRLAAIQLECSRLKRGGGLFLFAVSEVFQGKESALAVSWQNCRGQAEMLID